IAEFQLLTVFVDQEEPVATPRNVSSHGTKTRHLDSDVSGEPITRHIRHFNVSILTEIRNDNSDGCLDAMFTGTNSIQVRQRRYHADGPMPAHSQVPRIVEKDDAGHAPVI